MMDHQMMFVEHVFVLIVDRFLSGLVQVHEFQ
jgi:hypothetical protein